METTQTQLPQQPKPYGPSDLLTVETAWKQLIPYELPPERFVFRWLRLAGLDATLNVITQASVMHFQNPEHAGRWVTSRVNWIVGNHWPLREVVQ